MSIQDKIEEIRRQPEHIRLRWVWILTAVSMLFVIIVWIFSLKDENVRIDAPNLNPEQRNILEDLEKNKESFQDTADQMKNALKKQAETSLPSNP